jgi:hypothetical protein
VAGSTRFRRRVRVQGNRTRASRLTASDVRAEREQRAGDATGRGDSTGGYAGVSAMFQQHTCVSSGGLAREQENPEVRGGVGIANQSGSIILSHGPRRPAAPIPRRSSEQDHNTSRKLVNPLIELLRSLYAGTSSPWQSRLSSPRITMRNTSPVILHPLQIPWQASSSSTEPCHYLVLLTADPFHRGNSLSAYSSPQPKLPQGLP